MIRRNGMLISLLLLLALSWSLGWAQSGSADGSSIVDEAIGHYDRGDLAEAERLALRALSKSDSLSQFEKFSLHKLLGFIAVANDDEEGAVRQFVDALVNNPTLTPDPITWSPKVRKVFEIAREEHLKQMEIRRQRQFAVEAELCRRASLRSMLLPGSGQYLKGHKQRGTVLGVLFWSSAAAFVAGQFILPKRYDEYQNATKPDEIAGLWRDYRDARYMVNIAGIVAMGVYGYSFFDALWAHPSQGQIRDTDE